MNENHRQVLQMLATGQITAEEAERLITALEKDQPMASPGAAESRHKAQSKYLRVVVDADDDDGPVRVNIRVPFQLLRAGVKLVSLIPELAKDKINEELAKNGLAVDVAQIRFEDLEGLVEHLDDLTVDVTEKQRKVRIFAE